MNDISGMWETFMRNRRLKFNPVLQAAILMGALSIATGAHAQTCSVDLVNLSSQIQIPDLQQLLSTPIDEVVAKEGGLEQAISHVQGVIERMQTARDHLDPNTDADSLQYANEALLIASQELEALVCRRGMP